LFLRARGIYQQLYKYYKLCNTHCNHTILIQLLINIHINIWLASYHFIRDCVSSNIFNKDCKDAIYLLFGLIFEKLLGVLIEILFEVLNGFSLWVVLRLLLWFNKRVSVSSLYDNRLSIFGCIIGIINGVLDVSSFEERHLWILLNCGLLLIWLLLDCDDNSSALRITNGSWLDGDKPILFTVCSDNLRLRSKPSKYC
jgi:hypothetical protein